MNSGLGRLHVITDERLILRRNFLERIRQVAASGVQIIQFREKSSLLRDRAELGQELSAQTKRLGIKLIVNDDPLLARLIKADGVHLGAVDPPVEAAHELLGPNAIIGVSCYGDLAHAIEMERRGASYVSFGAFFPSPTKPDEPLLPMEILGKARRRMTVPIVAIGGVTAANAGALMRAGADSVAVVSAAFAARNAGRAVETLNHSLEYTL
ncbi:MAG: thiamine phosphate synthase [Elusimicrobia bacterium]|nr:thiamine phosphate synthase [Elusimicrobiota bacterium]